MDDLGKIRSAYPDPGGPTPEATDKARRRLDNAITASREVGTGVAPRLRFRRAWLVPALTASTAVAAVAVLAIPLATRPDQGAPEAAPQSSAPASSAPASVTARQVLRAAADLQALEERATGRFYRVRVLQIHDYARVGKPSYTIERRTISETWMPSKSGQRPWFGWVDLGSRPSTPQDEARWRAQGTPTRWKVSYDERDAVMGPGRPSLNRQHFAKAAPGYYLVSPKPLTAEQIAALPTDPAGLRALLDRELSRLPEADRPAARFSALSRLAFELPAPPKLRATGLRLLSDLPGIAVRTEAKDPIGRPGTALTVDLGQPPPTTEGAVARDSGKAEIIIDPETGRLLSSSTTGFGPVTTVVLESGWTDKKPTPPSPKLR